MKSLLVLSVMALSLSANAASTALITLTKSSGFSPRPQSVVLTISENGSVVKSVRTTKDATKETLAKLSANAVAALKDKIESIEDDAKLVDPNPKAPKCMDAPSTSVSVNKGGKEITLYVRASCHTSQVENGNADALIDLVTAFSSL
ncbi:MAG: hypothetical protein WC635_06385 [Bacteriovorax sp.]|jgi:hypothetical protein